MNSFTFTYPTKVYFGSDGVRSNLLAELKQVGSTVMLAYGGGSIKKSGVYDEMHSVLTEAGKTVVDFSGIMPNPTYAKVQEGAALAREKHVDFILAVGGGSVIDCCKIVSIQAMTDGDIWDMQYVSHEPSPVGIPMGAVVTASGTGSEMNASAVITHESKKRKETLFGSSARFAFLNPDYTKTVPAMQVMSGAFDTLSHALETYMGHSDADNVSDDAALSIIRNTVVNMRRLQTDPHDMQARGNLMWDSAMAETGILKVGRQTDFQVHEIEHQLSAYTDCNHGQGLAVLTPVYYHHIIQDAEEKLSRFVKIAFGANSVSAGLDSFSVFIRNCGLPTHLHDLASVAPITPELLRQVADTSNLIQTGPRPLTHDEIYEILMECR